MSEGKYRLRREIVDKYGKKEAIQYAKDVKSSGAFPGAQDLRRNLSNQEIKVDRIKGRSTYKTSEAYKTTTPSVKQQAERRLRDIQKDAAKSYTRKVAKETAAKAVKYGKFLGKTNIASAALAIASPYITKGINKVVDKGFKYLSEKNSGRKLIK